MSVTIPTATAPQKPTGSSFVIDSAPFGKGQSITVSTFDLADDKIQDWPMVYILSNQDQAYVGKTTSVINRMDQHGANPEKKDFNCVHIIFNEEFNVSVVESYEHKLIEYMNADQRYQLTNKNAGLSESNYYSKAEYDAMFEDLWEYLRDLELADHSMQQIEESEVFKYSPFKSLSPDQKLALDTIMQAIERGLDEAKPIVVEGVPGTGKTILAVYLLKALHDNPKYADLNVKMVEPMTALRETLRNSITGVANIGKTDILGIYDVNKPKYGYSESAQKSFDILLVDEAHRLKQKKNLAMQYKAYGNVNKSLGLPDDATQLDWILSQAKLPIFFYDPMQTVMPADVDRGILESKLGNALADPIRLSSQMRVKGDADYLNHIRALLFGGETELELPAFDGYEFQFHDSFEDFNASFQAHLAEHNLTRMVAGYAWPWATKGIDDPNAFDIEIDGIGRKWNFQPNNWVAEGVKDPIHAQEVGCIHSIQGYDLSYAYVIIGEDLTYDEATGEIVGNPSHYFDRNGKTSASPEEVAQYIKNIYYVLLTRGILGTHVYVVDEGLRNILLSKRRHS